MTYLCVCRRRATCVKSMRAFLDARAAEALVVQMQEAIARKQVSTAKHTAAKAARLHGARVALTASDLQELLDSVAGTPASRWGGQSARVSEVLPRAECYGTH